MTVGPGKGDTGACPGGIEARWIDDPGEWSRYRDGWDELVERSSSPTVFSTWDFLECSWLHFARPVGDGLAVITVLERGRPLGFLPLRVSTRRRFHLPLRRLCFLATWHSDRARPIITVGREVECAAAILGCLEERAKDWDLLELVQLASGDVFSRAVRAWAARPGRRLAEQPTSESPYVPLGSTRGAMAGLGSRMREGLRRQRRRLDARGACELEVFEKPHEIERAFDLYLDLERRSWKAGVHEGAGKDRRNEGFYRDLLPRLARRDGAAIKFLTQDGRRLAGEITYRLGSTAYGNQWTFDNAYASFSPGNLLRALSLEWHAARGAQRFELYARFLPNKLRWTSMSWDNTTLRVFQMRGLRRLVLFAPGLAKSCLRAHSRGSDESEMRDD